MNQNKENMAFIRDERTSARIRTASLSDWLVYAGPWFPGLDLIFCESFSTSTSFNCWISKYWRTKNYQTDVSSPDWLIWKLSDWLRWFLFERLNFRRLKIKGMSAEIQISATLFSHVLKWKLSESILRLVAPWRYQRDISLDRHFWRILEMTVHLFIDLYFIFGWSDQTKYLSDLVKNQRN